MDSVSVTVVFTSLSELIRAAEDIRRFVKGNDLEKTVLNPTRISLHKYRVWQQNWFGEALSSYVTAEALWGVQGWKIIRRMLDRIDQDSVLVREYLKYIRELIPKKPRSSWKTTATRLRSKQQPGESLKKLQDKDVQKLQELAAALSSSVDQLWIYSETVFDSLHGILAHETKVPEPEKLLAFAVQSRAGSLDLHTLCSHLTLNCCLEVDLLDTPNGPEYPFGRLFYHLFAQARESPQVLQELTVEFDDSEPVETDVVNLNESDLQLFKSQSGTGLKKIRVSGYGSNPPSCLVVQQNVGTMLLESIPDSLAQLLTALEKGTNLTTVERFSMSTKVELAYKVAECGFFLIGTPWFSSLSSKNILRMRSQEQMQPTFALEVQTVDHNDLLLDDPGALAETSQLFRLGIVLVEIALDESTCDYWFENHGDEAESIIEKLPSIEQSMGTQYCRATAFCLQHRQLEPQFQGPEKYEGKNFDQWRSYLANFLPEYYSQVVLRLQELKNVDTKV